MQTIKQTDGGPGSGRYPKGSGESDKTNVNETGENTFGTGFDGTSRKEHFERRQRDGHYKDLTEEQYEERALDLLQHEVGGDIDGFETKAGKIVRWNKITNDYAVGVPGVKVSTMYPLRGGQERFDKMRDRDEKKNKENSNG